jgi:hypothetical protein
MKKKHQTNRTNIETLKELFKEFNTTYKENFLIVKPVNHKKK